MHKTLIQKCHLVSVVLATVYLYMKSAQG